jgi:hypothetical protein
MQAKDKELQTKDDEHKARGSEIANLREELIKHGVKPPPNGKLIPDPVLVKAQEFWEKCCSVKGDFELELKCWQQAYEEALNTNTAVALHLREWHREVQGLYLQSKVWFKTDSDTTSYYRSASRRPWEPALQDAQRYLASLRAAAKKWDEWTQNDNMSFAHLEPAIAGIESPEVRSILTRWRADLVTHRGKWTLKTA